MGMLESDPLGSDRYLIGQQPALNPVEPESTWAAVPWRTIIASVGVVLATLVLVISVLMTARIVAWIVIAGFFAIVLAPSVRRVQSHVRGRRTVATAIVVFTTLLGLLGVVALFIV